MVNYCKFLAFLSVFLALPAFGDTWKNEAGVALVRPTVTATNPSTSPRVQPGQLVYVEHTNGSTPPPPLDIKSCEAGILIFHPDYGGNGSYDAELRPWDCHQGAPTLDEGVAGFDEEAYCGRVLPDVNGGGGVDNLVLNGDDGSDRDGDYLKYRQDRVENIRGAYLHLQYTTEPSGSDVSRVTFLCTPLTN